MSSPVEQAQVDKVAEAIWRADINTGHRDFISEADVSWAEDIGAAPKQYYRRMAVAAIEALQLTEERVVLNEYAARNGDPEDVQVRLVGPWRTA